MDQNTSELRHTLIYGLVRGGTICLYKFSLYLFALMNNNSLLSIPSLIFIVGGYLSVLYRRGSMNKGLISFKNAYFVTLLTMLIAGLLWAIYEYILRKYLSPYLLEQELARSRENLLQRGWPPERVDAYTTGDKMTAFTSALGFYFYLAIGSALISVLIAALVKRTENSY